MKLKEKVALVTGGSRGQLGARGVCRATATNAGRNSVSTPYEASNPLCHQSEREGEERFLRTSEW